MKNQFILDLQTNDGVKEGLKWILGNEYDSFESLLAQYIYDDNQELFTLEYIHEKLKIDWESIDLNNLWIKVYHFTTRANEDKAFGDIYNLFYLLTNETGFREFLRSHGIEFYLDKSEIAVDGSIYNLSEAGSSMNEALKWIHTKLYTDPEVWGFVRVLDIREYNSDFPDRPEFITNVAELLKDGSYLIDDWDEKYGKPYVIEFKQPFYSLQIYNNFLIYKNDFMKKEHLDEEEFVTMRDQYELEMKKGLFSLLLAIFMDNASRYGLTELAKNDDERIKCLLKSNVIERDYGGYGRTICAAVQKNENVPPDRILKAWEFEKFQENARLNNGYLK